MKIKTNLFFLIIFIFLCCVLSPAFAVDPTDDTDLVTSQEALQSLKNAIESQKETNEVSPSPAPITQSPAPITQSPAPTPAAPPDPAPAPAAPEQNITQESPVKKQETKTFTKPSPESQLPPEPEPPSESEEKAESSAPADLPPVDESEFLLPQVIAAPEKPRSENSLATGIIAWACIGIGVLIVLIVLINSRKSQDIELNKINIKSHRNKKDRKKKLLSNKYYKDISRY